MNEKELKYQEVNNSPTSVCCGTFYISNRKKYETCKKCDFCPKFIGYKTQKSANFDEVRFHYVDSFRKCELHKNAYKSDKVDSSELKQKTAAKHKPLTSEERQASAYLRLEKNHTELLVYTTWSELFAASIVIKMVEIMDSEIKGNPVFKKEIKHEYNKFYEQFKLYKSRIYSQCFIDGDYKVMEDVVNDISLNFLKLRISIENYINKFKVKHSYVMSHLLTCYEAMDELMFIHNENVYNIRLKEWDACVNPFMKPDKIQKNLDSVIRSISRVYGEGRDIDLGKDFNIVNGIKVLHNKIRNPKVITEIVYKIEEYHNNKNLQK